MVGENFVSITHGQMLRINHFIRIKLELFYASFACS